MIISKLKNIIRFNHIYVVGVFFNNTGVCEYTILEVVKKKDVLTVINSYSFDTIEDLKKLNKKVPVILSVDGKGIINKKVNLDDEGDVKWIRNLNYETIHYTSYNTDSNIFFSICKKDTVEELILQFKKENIEVLDVYLGSFFSYLLYSEINADTFLSGTNKLVFENGILTDFIKPEITSVEKYTIDKVSLSNFHLPLYGLAIHFFLPQEEIRSSESIQIDKENSIYKKIFNYYGVTLLVFFLVALLTSYMLIQHYGVKNNELNQESIYTAKTYQLIVELEKEKNTKLKLLNEVGILSDKFLSQYVYNIAESVAGKDIILEKVSVFPTEGDFKKDKKITIHSKEIILGGSVSEKEILNRWIENLGKIEWAESLSIMSLSSSKSGRLVFELNIITK